MLALAQKSRKAHTNATELRETRLAITENAEKKDVYLSPIHVNLCMGVKTNYLEVYSEVCSAENVVSHRNPIILISILVYVVQFEIKLRGHYTIIYEYMQKGGAM